MHPKVKAGAQTAALGSAIIVILALAGVKLDDATADPIAGVLLLIAPVIAGFFKKA